MKDSGWLRESCTYECVNFQKKQRCLLLVCTFWASTFAVKHTHTHKHGRPLSGCLFYSNCMLYTLFLQLWNSLWFAFKPQKEAAKDWVLACVYVCVYVCVCFFVHGKQTEACPLSEHICDWRVVLFVASLSLSPSLFRIINSAWAD